jgi:protein-S-isoprenylcysteine O-methyltransferase Ste14
MVTSSGPVARRAFIAEVQTVAVMAVILILSAWSFSYWLGWAFLANFSLSMFALTAWLKRHDPDLLARRLKAGPTAEREPRQKAIQALNGIGSAGLVILPALDHRFGWSHAPARVVVAGDVLVALGFLIVFLVFKENTYASSVVEVGAEQRVIDSGPYAWVRHPMYAGALVLLTGTPLALGSFWGMLVLAPFAAILAWRLLDEEALLLRELPGYAAYRSKTRYRLIPFVW